MDDAEAPPHPAETDEHAREGLLHDLEAWLNTPMLVLSAVWLILLVIELTVGAGRAMQTVGTLIWVVFIAEYLLRLYLAPRKIRFVAKNWLTLLSLVVPALRLFRALRVLTLARAVRGVTMVRLVATANRGMNALRRSLSRRGLGYVLALTAVVTLLGAAGMQFFEQAGRGGGFESFGDALWWTAMIMTTMGSGHWPESAEGRFLAVLLSTYAFAVFGYITAAFASFFVDRDREETDKPRDAEMKRLCDEITRLREQLEQTREGR